MLAITSPISEKADSDRCPQVVERGHARRRASRNQRVRPARTPVNEQQPETGDSVAEADPNRQGRREGSHLGTANLATRDRKAGSSSITAGSTSPLNIAHFEIGSRSPALTAPFSRLPDGANGQT